MFPCIATSKEPPITAKIEAIDIQELTDSKSGNTTKNKTKISNTDARKPLKRVRILVKKLKATAHQQMPINITQKVFGPIPDGTILASTAILSLIHI